MCEKGIEEEKAGGKSEGICGQACLGGEKREHCMQKLVLEEHEHVHERLTVLCIPKSLQNEDKTVQRFAALVQTPAGCATSRSLLTWRPQCF